MTVQFPYSIFAIEIFKTLFFNKLQQESFQFFLSYIEFGFKSNRICEKYKGMEHPL